MAYREVGEPKEMVVIFKIDHREDLNEEEYQKASRRMNALVATMPGFISIKDYTGADGEVITIVRFRDEASLEAWRRQPEHMVVQRRGREEFYRHYQVQALKVIRDYEFWQEGEGT